MKMRCPECSSDMNVTYSRKESGYTIRTRKCKDCEHKEKTIEMFYNSYKNSVDKYNQIVELIKDQ